ncbi:MAG: hypothetical protein U0232_32055 [Thermomicrobiales bacterium]
MKRYLGPVRRAGQGVLLHGTPGDEAAVLRRAGFPEPEIVVVDGHAVFERSIDDLVALVFSNSASAPHLFGPVIGRVRSGVARPAGRSVALGIIRGADGDTELRIWRKARNGE